MDERAAEIRCPKCGYDLRGRELARGVRCPECGSEIRVVVEERKKTRMRALGEFVGHVWRAVKHDPGKKVVRKEVEEERREGGVVLRRTVIEEVEVRKKDVER